MNKELKVSLSGNLGFVSLDEVLRLLTRSGQRGAVTVRGGDIGGRVFVTTSGISLATTVEDDGLRNLLIKSELIDPTAVDSGSSAIDKDDHELVELLREVTVESLYRLGLKGETFEVYEGQEARFGSPRPFELEQLLEDSKRRRDDWLEVSRVVPDLSSQVRFERDLGEREEIKIRRDAWKVLSEVGLGASVTRIAEELGTTEFWTARVVARLVEEDLVHTETHAEEPPVDEPATWDTPTFEPTAADAPEETPEHETYHQSAPADEDETPLLDETGPGPVTDSEPAPIAEPTAAAAPSDAEEEEVDPNQSWWKEPENEADEDVEEDTEAFLEKVFSELESPTEEEEEGYGLLRRRRMGAMRDLGNES